MRKSILVSLVLVLCGILIAQEPAQDPKPEVTDSRSINFAWFARPSWSATPLLTYGNRHGQNNVPHLRVHEATLDCPIWLNDGPFFVSLWLNFNYKFVRDEIDAVGTEIEIKEDGNTFTAGVGAIWQFGDSVQLKMFGGASLNSLAFKEPVKESGHRLGIRGRFQIDFFTHAPLFNRFSFGGSGLWNFDPNDALDDLTIAGIDVDNFLNENGGMAFLDIRLLKIDIFAGVYLSVDMILGIIYKEKEDATVNGSRHFDWTAQGRFTINDTFFIQAGVARQWDPAEFDENGLIKDRTIFVIGVDIANCFRR